MTITSSTSSYSGNVHLLHAVKDRNILLSVGEEDDHGIASILKIWNIDNPKSPELVSLYGLLKTNATALSCSDNFQYIAVGFANGKILLFYGDLLREGRVQTKVFEYETNFPISGLYFYEDKNALYLYVASVNSVGIYSVTKDLLKDRTVIDEKGCEDGCSALSEQGELVTGRREAIYFYNTLGFGPCMAFEGDRKLISWFRTYCISVEQDSNSAKMNNVIIYEPKNKFTAFSMPIPNVTHIISEWGMVLVFTSESKVYQLSEKDTQTKLDTLFKKNLYQVAIDLVTTTQYDKVDIADIYRKYGDHLYGKGDFDGAIQQYIKTIGILEPSYVIKLFLDAQRIHNLTLYLQKLHENGIANANHTTLLLNCYTKLRNVEELDIFIKKPDLNFDVETAIKVCRQAGYYNHALDLAQREKEHNWYLKILLEDQKKHKQALKYIEGLKLEESVENMLKYGKDLVSALPSETSTVLMDMWTQIKNIKLGTNMGDDGRIENSSINMSSGGIKKTLGEINPEDFVTIFVNQPSWLIKFLEFIIEIKQGTPQVYNTLLELYLRGVESIKDNYSELSDESGLIINDPEERAMALLKNKKAIFDDGHALVLCKIHSFQPGILYFYEKMKLYVYL